MSEDQATRTESPADLLRRAARLRQHAQHFADDPMGPHLDKYAAELEARAARLAGGC
jgi:hypothetical protein